MMKPHSLILTLGAAVLAASPMAASAGPAFGVMVGGPTSDCFRMHGHFTLTGVKVFPAEQQTDRGHLFWVRAEATEVEEMRDQAYKVTNPVDPARSSVTVDKPIHFKGEVVPAGTNLLTYVNQGATIRMRELLPNQPGSVLIDPDFDFGSDTYSLRFAWQTADGITFAHTLTVPFKDGVISIEKPEEVICE